MGENKTIQDAINENSIKPIKDGYDPNTTIIELTDGTTLAKFEERYNAISKDTTELCIMASKLANYDRKIFHDYAVDTMGISNSVVTMMIKAGNLYISHEELKALPYTKTYELQPVSEQVDEFVETVGGYDLLPAYSQADLREKVKNYIKGANEIIQDESETDESTDAPDETPENESGNADDTTPTELDIALKATVELLQTFSEGHEIDDDDMILIRLSIRALSKQIRKGVIFNEE